MLSASWKATLENQEGAAGRDTVWGVFFEKSFAVMGRFSLVNAQDLQERLLLCTEKYVSQGYSLLMNAVESLK